MIKNVNNKNVFNITLNNDTTLKKMIDNLDTGQ